MKPGKGMAESERVKDMQKMLKGFLGLTDDVFEKEINLMYNLKEIIVTILK
jgi:hypothetical protein